MHIRQIIQNRHFLNNFEFYEYIYNNSLDDGHLMSMTFWTNILYRNLSIMMKMFV